MSDCFAIEPTKFLLAFCAVTVAAIPQSLTGMGFGLLAASSLLLVDPLMVPGTVIVMGMLVASGNALTQIYYIDCRELRVTLAGRLLGIAVAFVALEFVDNRETFSVLIAIVILSVVALSFVDIAPQKTDGSLFVAGAVSGVTGTLTSVGAPPVGIVYQRSRRQETSATLNAYFAIGGLLSGIAVWYQGWLGLRDVLMALALLPGLAIGGWLSRFLRPYADRNFRPLILWICAISAAATICATIG